MQNVTGTTGYMVPNWDEPTGATSPQAILFSGNFTIRPLCHERQLHHLATLPTGVTSPCISVEPPCESCQLVLPQRYHKKVLQSLHNDLGHQGIDRTLDLLRERVYWPTMTQDTNLWVDQCRRCQVANPARMDAIMNPCLFYQAMS